MGWECYGKCEAVGSAGEGQGWEEEMEGLIKGGEGERGRR